jgi:DNA polymerase I
MNLSIRSQFIAPKNKLLLAFDFSQAESWVVAFSAREESMKHALLHDDIHRLTATALFNKKPEDISKSERYIGKRCNHALAYRMSPERMAQVINKDAVDSGVTVTLPQAKQYHKRWHELYNIKQWWNEIEQELNQTRTLTTVYGRRRIFYNAWGDELFKEATAFIPQSTVADHALGAVQPELGISGGLLQVWKSYHNKEGIFLINTAHDSILLEVPKDSRDKLLQQIYKLLSRPMIIHGEQFTIPVDAEVGEKWGELDSVPKSQLM